MQVSHELHVETSFTRVKDVKPVLVAMIDSALHTGPLLVDKEIERFIPVHPLDRAVTLQEFKDWFLRLCIDSSSELEKAPSAKTRPNWTARTSITGLNPEQLTFISGNMITTHDDNGIQTKLERLKSLL